MITMHCPYCGDELEVEPRPFKIEVKRSNKLMFTYHPLEVDHNCKVFVPVSYSGNGPEDKDTALSGKVDI